MSIDQPSIRVRPIFQAILSAFQNEEFFEEIQKEFPRRQKNFDITRETSPVMSVPTLVAANRGLEVGDSLLNYRSIPVGCCTSGIGNSFRDPPNQLPPVEEVDSDTSRCRCFQYLSDQKKKAGANDIKNGVFRSESVDYCLKGYTAELILDLSTQKSIKKKNGRPVKNPDFEITLLYNLHLFMKSGREPNRQNIKQHAEQTKRDLRLSDKALKLTKGWLDKFVARNLQNLRRCWRFFSLHPETQTNFLGQVSKLD